jgi:hypothetical protein
VDLAGDARTDRRPVEIERSPAQYLERDGTNSGNRLSRLSLRLSPTTKNVPSGTFVGFNIGEESPDDTVTPNEMATGSLWRMKRLVVDENGAIGTGNDEIARESNHPLHKQSL